jgi:hypothetical protein
MSDHIFPYWDDELPTKTPHTASGKSLADRDNVELYIMSEDEEANLIEFIHELNDIHESGVEFQEWQEEILNKEFGDDKK